MEEYDAVVEEADARRRKRGRSVEGGGRKRCRKAASDFFDEEAAVDSDEEEEDEEEGEDDFIDPGEDLPDEDDRRIHRRPLLPREEEEEDVDEIERRIQERYAARSVNVEYDEEATDVEQQALLPSIRDSKLWRVKCAIGRARDAAVRLMQKSIDKGPEMQIRSAIALDHLENYVYIEADKEAHVKEAIKGMRSIFGSEILLVPIEEMTDVLSVESKAIDISRDTWVRMKNGIYKGDLAKVVNVDNVRQTATVKLIPRIDLQALANKLEGRVVTKKKAFTPPARLLNIDEARELHIRVERRRDSATGEYHEIIGGKNGMMFKDGFLYKSAALRSLSTKNVQPTFDEVEKFRQPGESTLFANRKKGHFMKGDRVIIVKGDLRNLKGWVEKVEEDTVHIKPNQKGIPKTLALSDKELCKYFEPGNHVKVVSGATEGATGMVVSVEGHVVNLVSDTTKELIRAFADNVVESSEVTSESCMMVVGGSRANGERNGNSMTSRLNHLRTPPHVPLSPMRPPHSNFGGRGHDALIGACVKIRFGHYKGCKGRVKDVKGSSLRIELESQMKVVAVERSHISDNVGTTAFMHPSSHTRTPLRDSGVTLNLHVGMRTPMHNRAWDPYASTSPPSLTCL